MFKKILITTFAILFTTLITGASPRAGDNPQETPAQSIPVTQTKLNILRITPQGNNVQSPSEIVIEFDQPMLPLGMRESFTKDLPIAISPEVKGDWRWINDKTLVLTINHESALKPATKYTVSVKAAMVSRDGVLLGQDYNHQFSTQTPSLNYSRIVGWVTPMMPKIEVRLNLKTTKESIEKFFVFVDKANEYNLKNVKVQSKEWDPEKGIYHTDLTVSDKWEVTPIADLIPDHEYILRAEPGLMAEGGDQPSTNSFDVREVTPFSAFKFIGFTCKVSTPLLSKVKSSKQFSLDADEEEREREQGRMTFTVENPQTPAQKCDPMQPVNFKFTAPILNSQWKKNLIVSPDPTQGHSEKMEFPGGREDYSSLDYAKGGNQSYSKGAPLYLKAAQDYQFTLQSPPQQGFFSRFIQWIKSLFGVITPRTDLEDEFGRKLAEPFSVIVSFDHRQPNFVIPYTEGILERYADSDVPLYVNNLTSATFTYSIITANASGVENSKIYEIAPVEDIQFAIPMKIRDMLQGKSGIVKGYLTTTPMVDKGRTEPPSLMVQVTPFNIQAKIGHFGSLIWVTDLATGQPVSEAKVIIYKQDKNIFTLPQEILAQAQTNHNGIAILPGTEILDPDLSLRNGWVRSKEIKEQLFIRIDKSEEMALLPLSSFYTLDTYRLSDNKIWDSINRKHQHLRCWGFTAQGIYRTGDKIQYKIYLRDQNLYKLISPSKGSVPAEANYDLILRDSMNNIVQEEKNIKFDDFGTYSGEITIAKSAPVGFYRFSLEGYMPDMAEQQDYSSNENSSAGQEKKRKPMISLEPMKVLISDFTPAPYKVSLDMPRKKIVKGEELSLVTRAELHSGGAYTGAPVSMSAIINVATFQPKHPLVENFSFSMDYETQRVNNHVLLFQKEGSLNIKGEFEVIEKIIPATENATALYFGKILLEGTVRDDRGKSVSANTTLDYFNGDRLVGLKATKWLYNTNKVADFKIIVIDKEGNPVQGVPVDLIVERKEIVAAKVKSAGNAYKTNETKEWVEIIKVQAEASKAPVTPDEAAILDYGFQPDKAGDYRLTAIVKDDNGNEFRSQLQFYVTGADYVLWGEENEDYLPLIPEKKEYSVGESAKILVKNPYPGAKALITVERLGVIDSFVQNLEGSMPTVEIPVKENYLPNFFVSITVFSPRVENKPLEIGELDMGKPATKTGYVALSVKDPYKEISVTATTEKSVYKPRDRVQLSLDAKVVHPSDTPEPVELAVVVLDQSVFDLLSEGSSYYNPYKGFYRDESLEVRNYTLLKALVGRMKFEKKGANPGGDGGMDLKMRNILKFVSYWNPSIKLDEHGKAHVEFEAPDNLTGWRILAIATTPSDRFGLGEGNFVVNKDTEIRPVMPNQVSEGDQFKAAFSVMNRTDKAREIRVSLLVKGDVDLAQSKVAYDEKVTIEPHKRALVEIPLKASTLLASTEGAPEGSIHFEVTAGDAGDTDALTHSLPVKAIRSLETTAFFGSMTEGKVQIPLSIPQDVHEDAGGLDVTLSPSVVSNLGGVFTYMRTYPYTCWEQKISRAIVAASFSKLSKYVSEEITWPQSENFIRGILAEVSNFQAANGGMAYFKAKDEYVDPFLSAFSALTFGWLKQEGYEINKSVEEKLLSYLRLLLQKDFTQSYYTSCATATVRALVLEALAQQGGITLVDLERFKPHVNDMGAYGRASFARTAMMVPGAEYLADEIVRELLELFSETTTQMTWAENFPKGSDRILDTPLRDTCAVLETFVEYAKKPGGEKIVGDKVFKMVKTVSEARKGKTHWENTQENLQCARALTKFSQIYEAKQPDMTIVVKMGEKSLEAEKPNAISSDVESTEVESVQIKDSTEIKFLDYGDTPQSIHVSMKELVKEKTALSQEKLTLVQEGGGRLYYSAHLQYAPKILTKDPILSGFEVRREYALLRDKKWGLLKEGDILQKGDLVQVNLFIMLPGDRTFVVVDDPIPGCLEPVDRKLATTSLLDAKQAEASPVEGSYWYKYTDWVEYAASRWAFYHQELRHDSARFYADYLPKGNYILSYITQVIADGRFSANSTHVSEMYNPETFGKTAPVELTVGEIQG